LSMTVRSISCFTDSMEQSSGEADSHSTSQEIPHLLWNLKVRYRVHNSAPLVPILSQMNPDHTFPPNFPKVHSNTILQRAPRSSKWSLSFGVSDQNFVCIPSQRIYETIWRDSQFQKLILNPNGTESLIGEPSNMYWGTHLSPVKRICESPVTRTKLSIYLFLFPLWVGPCLHLFMPAACVFL
jgi:hypothetical protein